MRLDASTSLCGLKMPWLPTGSSVAVPNWPVPSPSSTEMLSLEMFVFAVAMSSLPSPLASPSVTAYGDWKPSPMLKSCAAPKPPWPSPSSTDTVPAPRLAVTRSILPSPFTSPLVIHDGESPTVWRTSGRKPPLPSFSSTETSPLIRFDVAMSARPSPLKSAETTECA